jgi:hypothetical protein
LFLSLPRKNCTLPTPDGLGIFSPLLTAGRCYGLLAMGNGHAPGTATGLGIAGAAVAVMGFGVLRVRAAGLAVFFFAAFLIAGFLAGFFLAGFFLAIFFAVLRDAADWRAAGLRDADFFLRAGALRADFFFAAFFFAFAMTTSGCLCGSGYRLQEILFPLG